MNQENENFESTIFTDSIKLAIVSDLHYGVNSSNPNCRGDIAEILLQRAVFRLNRLVHPDITLVLGDVLDEFISRDTEKKLLHIKSILDKLDSPYIIIPGNHDCDADILYQFFNRQEPIEDICGIRFISFFDKEEPGFNASRSPQDLVRFREARKNYSGPIISLQHVCLFPPGRSEVPYNYTKCQ
jgi:calcineurin-like phosphoesterase family protein